MERKIYEFTEKKLAQFKRDNWGTWEDLEPKIEAIKVGERDSELKVAWKKRHHGKVTGWGMGKRDLIISLMRCTIDYQRGLWQGRVDKARGLDYSEERLESPYNLGYYLGYDEYESNRRGWDKGTRARFDAQYVEA